MNVREEKRAIRIKTIHTWITQAKQRGRKIDKDKLIATACVEFGCSKRAALEYLAIVLTSSGLRLEDKT